MKFCHYFSINLALKASLIPLQRKTIANTSHTPVLFNEKANQKYQDLPINSQERRACSKNSQFKVIVLS